MNLFAYCDNDPVNYSDGTGHMPVWAKICISIATIIVVNHVILLIECAVAESKVKETYTKDEAIKAIEEITGNDTVTFYKTNVQITGSNKIKSRYNRIYISKIIQNTVDENETKYTNRSTYGLAAEWFGHNLLCSVGYNPNEQTSNVNLDYDFKNNSSFTEFGTIVSMVFGCL